MEMTEKNIRRFMTLLFCLGAGIIYLSIQYIENKYLSYAGLLLGGIFTCISGYSAQAHMLKIMPFKNSYKKLKKVMQRMRKIMNKNKN
ncbi:hypothetical protein ACXX82_02475 [Glaciimonas sp. GNP009]